jgi:hypothetical protein
VKWREVSPARQPRAHFCEIVATAPPSAQPARFRRIESLASCR